MGASNLVENGGIEPGQTWSRFMSSSHHDPREISSYYIFIRLLIYVQRRSHKSPRRYLLFQSDPSDTKISRSGGSQPLILWILRKPHMGSCKINDCDLLGGSRIGISRQARKGKKDWKRRALPKKEGQCLDESSSCFCTWKVQSTRMGGNEPEADL